MDIVGVASRNLSASTQKQLSLSMVKLNIDSQNNMVNMLTKTAQEGAQLADQTKNSDYNLSIYV